MEPPTYALGFDVYGTLVDPLALAEPLQALIGTLLERALVEAAGRAAKE